MQQTVNRAESAQTMPYTWAQWINILLGIAVIVTPFVAQASNAMMTSDVIVGIVIVIVGLVSFFSSKLARGTAVSVINVLAGIWLLISTSFAGSPLLVWQHVVYGVLVIVTAFIVMGLHKAHMTLTHTGSQ